MQTEAPPTYSEYPTKLPDFFPIGSYKVKPVVNVTELQAHLRLLGAFYELKLEVQRQADGIEAQNKDEAWVVFVNRAVYRFFAWNSANWTLSMPGLYLEMMPPLDVLMVWHTYLLVRSLNGSIASSMPLTHLLRILDRSTRTKAACPTYMQRTSRTCGEPSLQYNIFILLINRFVEVCP
jgi:hypothetical protein